MKKRLKIDYDYPIDNNVPRSLQEHIDEIEDFNTYRDITPEIIVNQQQNIRMINARNKNMLISST